MEHVDVVFPVLLKVLSDSADKVVQHALQVLAEIISLPQVLDCGDTSQNKGLCNFYGFLSMIMWNLQSWLIFSILLFFLK